MTNAGIMVTDVDYWRMDNLSMYGCGRRKILFMQEGYEETKTALHISRKIEKNQGRFFSVTKK